jgi:hypothetical protein
MEKTKKKEKGEEQQETENKTRVKIGKICVIKVQITTGLDTAGRKRGVFLLRE